MAAVRAACIASMVNVIGRRYENLVVAIRKRRRFLFKMFRKKAQDARYWRETRNTSATATVVVPSACIDLWLQSFIRGVGNVHEESFVVKRLQVEQRGLPSSVSLPLELYVARIYGCVYGVSLM